MEPNLKYVTIAWWPNFHQFTTMTLLTTLWKTIDHVWLQLSSQNLFCWLIWTQQPSDRKDFEKIIFEQSSNFTFSFAPSSIDLFALSYFGLCTIYWLWLPSIVHIYQIRHYWYDTSIIWALLPIVFLKEYSLWFSWYVH